MLWHVHVVSDRRSTRAAAFWTFWRMLTVDAGSSARRELQVQNTTPPIFFCATTSYHYYVSHLLPRHAAVSSQLSHSVVGKLCHLVHCEYSTSATSMLGRPTANGDERARWATAWPQPPARPGPQPAVLASDVVWQWHSCRDYVTFVTTYIEFLSFCVIDWRNTVYWTILGATAVSYRPTACCCQVVCWHTGELEWGFGLYLGVRLVTCRLVAAVLRIGFCWWHKKHYTGT